MKKIKGYNSKQEAKQLQKKFNLKAQDAYQLAEHYRQLQEQEPDICPVCGRCKDDCECGFCE